MPSLNKSKVYLVESTLHIRFINFSHLVTMRVDSTKAQPKNYFINRGNGLSKPLDLNDCLTILPQTRDMIALQSCQNSGCLTTLRIVVA
jgi:hypothetical protein